MKKFRPLIIFAVTAVSILAVDMLSKFLVDGYVAYGKEISVIPKVINFAPTHNEGIAFSFLAGAGIWLAVFTSVLVAGACVLWWWLVFKRAKIKMQGDRAQKREILRDIAFGFFVGGAFGNLIDRIAFGYVRDFIKFAFWPAFAIFNFADMALIFGLILFLIYFIFFTGKKTPERSESKDAA